MLNWFKKIASFRPFLNPIYKFYFEISNKEFNVNLWCSNVQICVTRLTPVLFEQLINKNIDKIFIFEF